jgi:hypothetical protein
MSLWRRTRNEMAGAWRSLRYDLGQRPADPPRPLLDGPDVTSTGMSTFGGPVADDLPTGYDDELPRRPRRLLAVSAFGVLAVAGAGGSYYAVVHGLGSVLSAEKPAAAAAHPYPLAAAEPPAAAGNSGLGRGKAATGAGGAGAAPALTQLPTAAPGAPAPVATVAPATRKTLTRRATTERTTRPVPPVTCDCLTPPVPTPTAPSTSPSPTPSPSPSPSASDSATAQPGPSESSSTDEALRRKRHSRGY